MSRRSWVWLSLAAVLAVVVAVQTVLASRHEAFVASADAPTVAPGVDVLAGIPLVPLRIRGHDYRRAAFGDSWDDDNDAPGGHNGCDTRNDILKRDLTNIRYRSAGSCAVVYGTTVDPYTGKPLTHTGHSEVGIDHMIPLSYAWQMGASGWPAAKRVEFANDPLNLIAVASAVNSSKSDSGPASWLPPSKSVRCAYAARFAAVADKYGLAVTASDKSVMAAQCA